MKKIDNKGFTLVELMIGIAIMSLLSISIVTFIGYGSRNYRKAQEEVTLQVEAQTIINQLSDLIIEAYNVKYQDDMLIIYHNDAKYIITLDTSNNQLLYERVKAGELSSGDKKLFGQYVTSLEIVDTGENDLNKTIQISINLKKNNTDYSIKEQYVTIRNKIKKISVSYKSL